MPSPRRSRLKVQDGLTAQEIVLIERAEAFLVLDEDENDVLGRARHVIANLQKPEELAAFITRLMHEYHKGNVSNRTIKRCKAWIGQRLEEIHPSAVN